MKEQILEYFLEFLSENKLDFDVSMEYNDDLKWVISQIKDYTCVVSPVVEKYETEIPSNWGTGSKIAKFTNYKTNLKFTPIMRPNMENKKALELLQNTGYKVSIMHFRNYWELDENNRPVINMYSRHESPVPISKALPHGGRTVVTVTNPNNGKYLTSVTECSKKEQFNKSLGTKIGLNRILKFIDELK